MAIRVDRADLVSALSAVARIIESCNTIPVLANVHLSVAEGRLTVRGTDLDIQVTTSVTAAGDLKTTTAPARTLLEVAKKFPAGAEVTVDLEDDALIVKSGRSRFKLATLDAKLFPDIKAETYDADFEVDLDSLFAPVRFAISTDSARYHLNGVYLNGEPGLLTAVATDGHRLAKHVLPGEWPDFTAVIVPTKFAGTVPQGPVTVSVNATKIRVKHGDTTIVSKLIEGTFPDYERVIPVNNDRVVTANRTDLIAAVDRVATVASDRGGKTVKFEADGDAITLTVRADHDSASDELATDYDGLPVETGMNAAYLKDILGAVTGASVSLAFSAEMSPILLRGDNDNWLGVQMPMRA